MCLITLTRKYKLPGSFVAPMIFSAVKPRSNPKIFIYLEYLHNMDRKPNRLKTFYELILTKSKLHDCHCSNEKIT